METTIYTDGTYFRNNPAWHTDDSPWKAAHVAALLARNGVEPASVCDIGCGAGEILRNLGKHLPASTKFYGYDVSPDAYRICRGKQNARFQFRLGDAMAEPERFDLVMAIDVFEHVEDCFGFLRGVREKGRYKVFHIPLDLSALAVARAGKLSRLRRAVGHLHYFTKDTALALLEDTGYRVIEHAYTAGATERRGYGWKAALLRWPRRALFALAPDLAARWLGGYSLLVLAE